MKEFSLEGQRALVVGGSSGIGFHIAAGLQRAGARVAIAARTASKVESAAATLKAERADALGFVADVARHAEIVRLRDEVNAALGGVDILINSQGTTVLKQAVELTEAEYDWLTATNLKSVFFCCTLFGKDMIGRGAGSIVNIASLAAHRGFPKAAVYSITKYGVAGLTHALAAEWGTTGVRVNAISPGFFMTDLNRDKMAPERKENALRRTPMGRFGELEELVGAAIYLSSPAAAFTTGTIINVDGGYLASGI